MTDNMWAGIQQFIDMRQGTISRTDREVFMENGVAIYRTRHHVEIARFDGQTLAITAGVVLWSKSVRVDGAVGRFYSASVPIKVVDISEEVDYVYQAALVKHHSGDTSTMSDFLLMQPEFNQFGFEMSVGFKYKNYVGKKRRQYKVIFSHPYPFVFDAENHSFVVQKSFLDQLVSAKKSPDDIISKYHSIFEDHGKFLIVPAGLRESVAKKIFNLGLTRNKLR